MTKLSKLDNALDTIAAVFYDPIQIDEQKEKEGGAEKHAEVRNRQAWAQRDILQAIAWKANSALDRNGGADERMARIKAAATEMAEKPSGEFDIVNATRLAQDAEFWGFQQEGLLTLMEAASKALVRHGHEAYVRRDLTKRGTVSSDSRATNKTEAQVASIFSKMGVTIPART